MIHYEEYKKIDLPWLNEIPAHWDVYRNKQVFAEMKNEVGKDSSNYTLLSLTLNGVIPRDIKSGKGKFPASFDKYKIVEKDNLAFCLFDMDETPRTVGLAKCSGMLTGAYTIMKVSNINPRYAYYYYLSLDNVKAMRPLYTGLRKTINIGTFLGIKMPVPTEEEQDQIVKFLDWQLSRINNVIKTKRKEIELLQEKRQQIIDAKVLTSPRTELTRASEGDWNVDIPKGWDILKFNGVFSFGKGLNITKANLEEDGIPVISYGQVHSKNNLGTKIDDSLIRFVNESYLETSSNSLVHPGDFIFADTSEDFEGVGNCVFVDREGPLFAGYHTVIARPKDGNENRYLSYLFKSSTWRYQLRKNVNGVKVFSVTQKVLKNAYVFLPPLDEQREIVEFLDEHCEGIDSLIADITKEIDLLKDYEMRLISDVSTGKVDVRSVEIPDFMPVEEDVEEDSEGETEDEFECDEV